MYSTLVRYRQARTRPLGLSPFQPDLRLSTAVPRVSVAMPKKLGCDLFPAPRIESLRFKILRNRATFTNGFEMPDR